MTRLGGNLVIRLFEAAPLHTVHPPSHILFLLPGARRVAGLAAGARGLLMLGTMLLCCGGLVSCVGSGEPAAAPGAAKSAARKSKQGIRMRVRTTAYTHTEPGGISSAIGTRLRFGSEMTSAASDWSWLPVGTRFTLLSSGRTYVIEDYGSALVGRKTIDLYMPTMSAVDAWGVRWEEIQIHEMGSFPISRMLLEKRRDNRSVRAMLATMPSKPVFTASNPPE